MPLRSHTGNDYSLPEVSATLRVLCIRLRGVAKVKPEGGTVRIQFDPVGILHMMFFKHGEPVAVGTVKEVTRERGDWIVAYQGVKWLNDEPA